MKIVISGAPHSGKTTLLAEMKRRGHPVVVEAALDLIKGLADWIGVEEQAQWRREWGSAFQDLVARRQIKLEREAPTKTLVFLDRSLVDVLAYCELLGVPTPPRILDQIAAARYERVFVLDLVLPFSSRQESGRTSDEARARKTHSILLATYRGLGFDPTELPVLSVNERADRLLAVI